ncbi:AAA family ATPase [Hydrogenophaga borbori]
MVATSSTEQFRDAISAAGLTPPDEIFADGQLHRFSTNGRHDDDSGWYVFYGDGIPAGAFGCWRSGLHMRWCAKADDDMTAAERKAHRQRTKAMQLQREAEQAQVQQQAREVAALAWTAAAPAIDHDYLTRKGINVYGVKRSGRLLLIPMRDISGTLHSLQTIAPDGTKRFQPDGRVKGCYHAIGKPDGLLIVCEGYATGASIHVATGHAVAVAFNAGNLRAVAEALRGKHPALKIIIAADDDARTPGNPGLRKAIEAARAVGGYLTKPDFGNDRQDGATDFNDLHQMVGADAVRACIEAAELVESTPMLEELREVDARPATPEVVLLNGADLEPEPVRWLWPDWLALGKLHILAGAPGQGKTTIALAFAATVTMGGHWPDASRSEAGSILIWSGEDDPADTLLPRLLAAGADRARCYFVGGTRIDGEVQSFDPARDMGALEAQARRIGGIKLLIVDPVVSAVAGDSHKNTEVRRALQPLVDLASRLDAAVLGISHFSKGGAGSDPASRVVGSIAFSAVARVVLVAAKVKGDDDEQDRWILARGKSNIGPDDGGFEYHIEQSEPIPGIRASHIAWGKPVAGSARDLLTESEADTGQGGDSSARAEAKEFLIQLLKDGATPTKHVQAEAKAAGIAWRTVRRASDALGIKKYRLQGAWYWDLPNLAMQLGQDGQRLNGGQVGALRGQHAPSGVVGVEAHAEKSEVF